MAHTTEKYNDMKNQAYLRFLLMALLLLVCLCLFVEPLFAQAQQQDLLAQPVKMGRKSATIERHLSELRDVHHVNFSYNDDALPLQKQVQLTGNETTVKEVLDVLLNGTGMTYVQRGNLIIFRKAGRKTGSAANGQQRTISGYVRESGSGELLPGVNVYVPELQNGTTTNTYGFYSLTLPADSLEIIFSFVGYQPVSVRLLPGQNLEQNVALEPRTVLQEVVITDDRSNSVSQQTQMSVIDIPVAQVKDVPVLFGEKDVLKTVQLMPGVQKSSEGQTGLYVRGGGPDQNLIILDDATVYNASHLFGFFSLFNGDALKSVELTKGGFPARYGGRLSSVLDMNMKDGNRTKIQGEAGIGLIASRFVLEGPLIRDKASFLISARRTYLDALIAPAMPREAKVGYYFGDLNAKVNYEVSKKDKLYLSTYLGRDRFYFNSAFTDFESLNRLQWGNGTATLRWNHQVDDKTFSNTSFIYSNYRFNIRIQNKIRNERLLLNYFSGIRDFTLKRDYEFYPNPNHTLRLGLVSTYHHFTPNAMVAKDTELDYNIDARQKQAAVETGLYAEHQVRVTRRLSMNNGLRLSHFTTQGRHYFRPEPRVSASYRLTESLAAKASFATMNQYIHLLSNTGAGMPTDLWVPATRNVGPQQSHQVAAGLAKDLYEQKLAITLEGYYKKSNNIIHYKDGATFIAADDPATAENETDWEHKVTIGQGWSYGAEFLLQKKAGKFTGWIGYTLSWTQLQFDSLNFGKKFYARYDRRHDISVVGVYKLSEDVKLSAVWVYGSGNAITLPLAEYTVPNHNPNPGARDFLGDMLGNSYIVSDYGERNNYRMEAYHRLDLGVQFTKDLGWAQRTWEFSVYNFYNRHNPYYYYIGYRGNNIYDPSNERTLKKVYLFSFLPSVSYNLKF